MKRFTIFKTDIGNQLHKLEAMGFVKDGDTYTLTMKNEYGYEHQAITVYFGIVEFICYETFCIKVPQCRTLKDLKSLIKMFSYEF